MSDVQPIIYMEDLERGTACYRDQLGFDVGVFGHHPVSGVPLVAGAKLEDALVLLTREELFAGGTGSGCVRLYFHPRTPVDELFLHYRDQPDLVILQEPTDQHWGDRPIIVQDPWGVGIVFSNPATAAP